MNHIQRRNSRFPNKISSRGANNDS